jgi:pimeloyl-ACP methyl ester carboxylesterase
MSTSPITRHLLACAHGYMHYRSAGSEQAPQVLLLHQAPQNSRGLIDLIRFLSDTFYVIAPDMPGFGLSDALANPAPAVEDYAGALNAFVDQIGFQQCAIYGLHTGAAIASAMGAQKRYRRLALDGLPKFSDEERTEFMANFFPDFSPVSDGSHLSRLWHRMRDQYSYFPWFKKSNPIQLNIEITPQRIQSAVDDVLMTGGSCWLGYRAALAFDAKAALQQLQGPATLLFREEDLISSHQQRFGKLPANVNVCRFGTVDHWKEIRIALLEPIHK